MKRDKSARRQLAANGIDCDTYGMRDTVTGQRDNTFQMVLRHGENEFVLLSAIVTVQRYGKPMRTLLI